MKIGRCTAMVWTHSLELKLRIGFAYQQTKVKVSLSDILATPSITAFAELLAGRSELVRQ